MQFTAIVAACVAVVTSVNAVPIGPTPLDVWSPAILYPNAATVWVVGQHHNVTWDISNPPASISNLAAITLESASKNYGPVTLASGFDLHAGRFEIQVPSNAPASSDYAITLYGDSGNVSPNFQITH